MTTKPPRPASDSASGFQRFDGHLYRVSHSDGPPAVLTDAYGPVRRMTRAEILSLKPTSKLWKWLYDQGIRRPSPSGKSGRTQSYADRKAGRVPVQCFLSHEDAAFFDVIAAIHGSRTAALESLLESERKKKK